MMIALRLMMMMALLLGGSAGTVAAARDSLPGSILYPLKVQFEQWEMARAIGALAVSEKALSQSQTRLWEVNQLANRGRTVPEDVGARYGEQLGLALQASGTLTEPLRLQTQSRISETLQHHVRTMAQIAAKAGKADEDQVIQAMIRTMEQTQAQIGAGTGQNDAGGSGEAEQAGPAAGEQVQTGPGEVNEDHEGYGPNDQDSSSGPGFGQPEKDDGSGSVNGPDNDNGQNGGEQINDPGGSDNGGGNGNR